MISVHWTPLATWDNYFVAASNAVKVGQHSGQVIGLDLLSNYFHKQLVSDRVLPRLIVLLFSYSSCHHVYHESRSSSQRYGYYRTFC